MAFKRNGEVLVGKGALEYSHSHPERVVRWIKRQMGTDYTVSIDGKSYTPQDISAFILRKLKTDAETYLGEAVDRAVITVPAYFNNNKRNATKKAGELAGFNVLRIISEPTAASLAYGLNLRGEVKVAVADLGSGTFDVSILDIYNGVLNVISTSGDTHLGGKDMDDLLLRYVVDEIRDRYSLDVSSTPSNMAILRDAVEEMKVSLSTREHADIRPTLIVEGREVEPSFTLTRHRLEQIIKPIVSSMDAPMRRVLEDSRLTAGDIDRLVLVGGPTLMPIVRRRISDFFGIDPECGIDPMGIVATGAFIQASILDGEIRDLLLLDVTPLSLGMETSGGVFTRLIPRNTTIPVEERRIFTTAVDEQQNMMIHVLQGEREMAPDNASIGLFSIDGIPPSPRFEQEVEVTFALDEDGILHVKGEVLETSNQTSITIERPNEITLNELTNKIIEASQYQLLDETKLEMTRMRENAKAVLYGARQTAQRILDKLPYAERSEYIGALDKLEMALMGGNGADIRRQTGELKTLIEKTVENVRKLERAKLLGSTLTRKRHDDAGNERAVLPVATNSHDGLDTTLDQLKEALLLLEVEGGLA